MSAALLVLSLAVSHADCPADAVDWPGTPQGNECIVDEANFCDGEGGCDLEFSWLEKRPWPGLYECLGGDVGYTKDFFEQHMPEYKHTLWYDQDLHAIAGRRSAWVCCNGASHAVWIRWGEPAQCKAPMLLTNPVMFEPECPTEDAARVGCATAPGGSGWWAVVGLLLVWWRR